MFTTLANIRSKPSIPVLKNSNTCSTYLIVVGCEYRGQPAQLLGCARDAMNIAKCFHSKYAIPKSNIFYLTEDNQNLPPTRQNIMNVLQSCIQKADRGQCRQIIFYYSGHGTGIMDQNGDEIDGQDEVILPNDYNKSGVITDDELYQIFKQVPENCKTLYIFDSCNSGTMGDLEYQFNSIGDHTSQIVKSSRRQDKVSSSSICISGCKDNQTSTVIQENGVWESALTLALLEILQQNTGSITLKQLEQKLRDWMISRGLTQKPMVTFSNPGAGNFSIRVQ